MGEERYRQQVEKEISDLKEKLSKKEAELGRTKGKLRMYVVREAETNSKYEKLLKDNEKLLKEHKKCQEYMKKYDLGETTNPLYSRSTMRASKKKKKRKSSKKKKRSRRR